MYFNQLRKPQNINHMKTSFKNNANLAGKLSFAILVAISLSLASCKKDDDDKGGKDDDTTLKLGEGTLVAIKTQSIQSTPIGDVTVDIGTAVAVFSAGSNWSSFADAGTVEVNGSALQKFNNNSYAFTPGAANPMGIEFGNSVQWTIAGNSASGVPAFNHTVSGGFPNVGNVNVDETVSKAAGLNLPITGVSNADSLYVNINEVVKVLPANASSANFTASDLSSLSNGTAVVSIAAVRYTNANYGGKTFWFLNETVKQKTVTISN
jgi:hypothetical protein